MCGILGVAGRPTAKEPFAGAFTELVYRGPDDGGIYQDGHVSLRLRRLAILDLSQSGLQPMRNEQEEPVSGAVEIAMLQHGRLLVTRGPYSWVGCVWA